MPALVDPVVTWIAALAIALLFAASALHKLRDWSRFTGALANYHVLPAPSTGVVAVLVVVLEVACVVLLANPAWRPAGAVLAAALLLLYGAAIAVNLRRGRTSIDCGCVGAGERRRIHRGMVLRNVVLAGVALGAALPAVSRPITPLDALTVAGSIAVAALLYLAADTLAAYSRRRSPA
jgi:uncharacterized membrane protein YphA (DoxX/SURF4 family)